MLGIDLVADPVMAQRVYIYVIADGRRDQHTLLAQRLRGA
jgi:hypothetical protein